MPLHRPPEHLFEISFSQPSILGPALVALAALYLGIAHLLLTQFRQSKVIGFLSLGLVAAVFAGFLVFAFPQILEGAAAGLSPAERLLAANMHPESWAMIRVFQSDLVQYAYVTVPLAMALGAGIVALRGARSRKRRLLYAAYFSFAALSGGLAQIFWRYVHHAMTAASVWLLWAWQRIRARLPRGGAYVPAAFGVFFMLCPFWLLLLPALDLGRPASEILFYPAKVYTNQDKCDVDAFAHYLDAHYDPKTLLIVSDWESSRFLYYTHLRLNFLANYPSQNKFIDNMMFFQSQDPDVSRHIAAAHGIDLVALCRIAMMAPDVARSRQGRAPMLLESLIEGRPPDWLKPVQTGLATPYLLFEVDKIKVRQGS